MSMQPEMRGALIDWCGMTFEDKLMENVPLECKVLLEKWMGEVLMGEDVSGRNFYKNTVQFFAMRAGDCVQVAHVAWGGDSQNGRANIQISGTGCSLIQNWSPVQEFVDASCARLTRVDVAVDLLKGEYTVDDAFQWYRDGKFNINRAPTHCVHGPWLDASQGTGRTLEVGRRKNGKMARIYEKGKQLGDASSEWVRFEGELHNIDREIPSDILTNPSPYFAGMYPCFEQLLEFAAARIATEQLQGETSIERLLECMSNSYGKALFVARLQSHDHADLLDRIEQQGIPKRLKRSSLHFMDANYSPPVGPMVIGELHGSSH
jgi:phage replication initiation protein